jgi:hypothetical protein
LTDFPSEAVIIKYIDEREIEIAEKKMRVTHRVTIFLFIFLLSTLSLPPASESSPQCKAWLVQSIPTDMPHLPRVPGVLSTG